MNLEETLVELRSVADPSRLPGMARVGIRTDRAMGVSVPLLRKLAKRAGRDQELAAALWDTEIHEARILATLVADPEAMSARDAEAWVTGIDSWDVGDAAADLFASMSERDELISAWAVRDEPFVKRCAFAMIARRAVSDRTATDADFRALFPLIRGGAQDDRNEVKKAVSWALRQIGKRDRVLHAAAIAEAEQILEDALASGSKGARWVARDVLRELWKPEVSARIRR